MKIYRNMMYIRPKEKKKYNEKNYYWLENITYVMEEKYIKKMKKSMIKLIK